MKEKEKFGMYFGFLGIVVDVVLFFRTGYRVKGVGLGGKMTFCFRIR